MNEMLCKTAVKLAIFAMDTICPRWSRGLRHSYFCMLKSVGDAMALHGAEYFEARAAKRSHEQENSGDAPRNRGIELLLPRKRVLMGAITSFF